MVGGNRIDCAMNQQPRFVTRNEKKLIGMRITTSLVNNRTGERWCLHRSWLIHNINSLILIRIIPVHNMLTDHPVQFS